MDLVVYSVVYEKELEIYVVLVHSICCFRRHLAGFLMAAVVLSGYPLAFSRSSTSVGVLLGLFSLSISL